MSYYFYFTRTVLFIIKFFWKEYFKKYILVLTPNDPFKGNLWNFQKQQSFQKSEESFSRN